MSLSQNNCLESGARRLVRSRDKNFTAEDQKRLDLWLEESHANRKAFEEMSGTWEQAGVIEHVFEPGTKDEHREVDINASGRLAELRLSNIKQVLAWQKQQVVFRNTPVDEVLRELAFYQQHYKDKFSGSGIWKKGCLRQV